MEEYVRVCISGDFFGSFVCKAVRTTQCDQKQRLLLAENRKTLTYIISYP